MIHSCWFRGIDRTDPISGKFVGPGGSGGRREPFTHLHTTSKAEIATMYKYGGFMVILGSNPRAIVKNPVQRAS